ncbi:MAG: N-methyl-L-tryptophan oxidase [Actinomycetota bacterium]
MSQVYDCIVVGTGGVGAATLFHLARRGARAIGVDRFAPGHDRGSSHGETRLFRLAYFEHEGYVPLLQRARELWLELGEQVGTTLYHELGILEVGDRDGPVVGGVLESASRHDLLVEELSPSMVERRWPGFTIPAGQSAVFEPTAGYLSVEACVEAHAQLARAHGAVLDIGSEATTWSTDGDDVLVSTSRREYRARRAVITAGAWAPQLLGTVAFPLDVRRQSTFWFAADDRYGAASGMPAFFFEDTDGPPGHGHYGVPALDRRGVKVARHHGGRPVDDPSALDRTLDPAELADATGFLARCLPGVGGEMTHHAVCMYTNSPDGHFVVDRHSHAPQVQFAAGLSGHGFKFASVLGEVLADLALEGGTDHPIEFLGAQRFANIGR